MRCRDRYGFFLGDFFVGDEVCSVDEARSFRFRGAVKVTM